MSKVIAERRKFTTAEYRNLMLAVAEVMHEHGFNTERIQRMVLAIEATGFGRDPIEPRPPVKCRAARGVKFTKFDVDLMRKARIAAE
jgi:hypothetical protein